MKNMYLIGGSGTGKTTLARNLEMWFPEGMKRTVETATRPMREGEIADDDYHFITKEEFYKLDKNEVYETLQYQFPGNLYCCLRKDLDPEKWNLIVASIEGIFSALNSTTSEDESVIFHIIADEDPDVLRENRNYNAEQNINLAILRNMFHKAEDGTFEKNPNFFPTLNIGYCEIMLSELKQIRNDKDAMAEFFARYGI